MKDVPAAGVSRLQRVRFHCVLLVILALCGCTSTDTRGISEWLSHGWPMFETAWHQLTAP